MMKDKGFKISNIDIQVSCKSPRLADKIFDMRKTLADHLDCSVSSVSVKAASYNGVGPIGQGEAIMLGPTEGIKEGETVKRTQRIASVLAGEGMLG